MPWQPLRSKITKGNDKTTKENSDYFKVSIAKSGTSCLTRWRRWRLRTASRTLAIHGSIEKIRKSKRKRCGNWRNTEKPAANAMVKHSINGKTAQNLEHKPQVTRPHAWQRWQYIKNVYGPGQLAHGHAVFGIPNWGYFNAKSDDRRK